MRHLFFLILLVCTAAPTYAQVCSGDVTLLTQAEVNAFDCTNVMGSLTVGELTFGGSTDIADLTPLSSLSSVAGELTIFDNALTSLEGLGNLSSVGGTLAFISNALLTSLDGLADSTAIGGLDVSNNDALPSLEGLERLLPGSPDLSISVEDNNSLISLVGLEELTSANPSVHFNIDISDNADLETLDGLGSFLGSEASIIDITGNNALVSLGGLGSVTFLDGLIINNNDALASLSGLENLSILRSVLFIENNGALESLSGLEGLTFVGNMDNPTAISFVSIEGNSALESLDGLGNLASVNELIVDDNEVLAECSCGLSGLISGDPPMFSGVNDFVVIRDNDPSGACTSPGTVLANPCPAPSNFNLAASNTNPPGTPIMVAQGDSVSFDYSITNSGPSAASGDLWFTVSPSGLRGVIRSGTVPAGATVNGSFVQNVPGNAAPNTYTYTLNIGRFPGAVVDSEAFTAVVSGSARALGSPEAWTVTDVTPWQVADETARIEAAASEALPEAFALAAAYPNPFASSTTVGFALPEAADVRVAVYDVLGREVAVLTDGAFEAGRHTAQFDAAGLTSGVYLVRLTVGDVVQTQRVTLAR